ncbi:MAG: DUF3078 domain-containing protein [Bacteroidales bacterium]|nr:DUF3078 domain-containing protein [Bacteroidales bacterium]
MKRLTIAFMLIAGSLAISAQTTEPEEKLKKFETDTVEGWKTGGTITLNLSQVSLINWAAGGQNSISVNGLFSTFAVYHKDKKLWENFLDIGYGTIKQGENANWWKTDDKIDFTSKYGQKISKQWYYAALLNLKTQVAKGYDYPNDSMVISNLLAPGYVLGAIGMDYQSDFNFTAFLAPITLKTTIVRDQELANAGAFGVEPAVYDTLTGNVTIKGRQGRTELGGYIRLGYKLEPMQNITLQTKIDFFSNYLNKPQT